MDAPSQSSACFTSSPGICLALHCLGICLNGSNIKIQFLSWECSSDHKMVALCISYFCTVLIIHPDQKQERKGFISPYDLKSTMNGNKGIKSRQELEAIADAETMEDGCLYWLAPHTLVSVLPYTRTKSGLGPLTSVTIKRCSHRLPYRTNIQGIFLM